jgi:hypothetical protein
MINNDVKAIYAKNKKPAVLNCRLFVDDDIKIKPQTKT